MSAREALGLIRLAAIEKLHARASRVLVSDDRSESRTIVRQLLQIAHQNPHALQDHVDDIIDGADMIRLAERELMTPLDSEARALVSAAAQRVSIVTALSPRAMINVLFVLVAALRLIRQLARLYGGRPGAFGMIRLVAQVIAHLAITGGMAASDSLVQQVLGHGVEFPSGSARASSTDCSPRVLALPQSRLRARCRSPRCRAQRLPISPRTFCASAKARNKQRLSG